MTRLGRRSALRAGLAVALATPIAGCTGAVDSPTSGGEGIPGVEDGEVVDHHAFASAHHDQLAARTGTLEWTRVSLDRETGDPESHTVWTVRVDGDRVHAIIAGRSPLAGGNRTDGSGSTRREFYFPADDTTLFYRTRTDGEWKVRSAEPNDLAITTADFTGKGMLEMPPLKRVGTETVDGEELYRFSHATRAPDSEQVRWTSIQALVDGDALAHSFHQTLDRTGRNSATRRVDEWHLVALDATTVERPDWVQTADA